MTERILSRQDFLSGDHLKKELVPVPDLDGSIWIRELGTGQILAFNQRVKDLREAGVTEVTADQSLELMTLIISMSACDPDGNLIFTEADVSALLINKINVLQTLADKVMELSGLQNRFDGDAVSEVAADLKNDLTISSSSV